MTQFSVTIKAIFFVDYDFQRGGDELYVPQLILATCELAIWPSYRRTVLPILCRNAREITGRFIRHYRLFCLCSSRHNKQLRRRQIDVDAAKFHDLIAR